MRRLARPALIALFAASGFAGLIYESIWTHYLKLFLGHAAYAQTLVLAIFMGGMAVGSWLAARFATRWRNLLAAYAITEAAIGVLALVFHEVFSAATEWAYASSLLRFAVFKWSLAALLILPQCVLLGMTFPLMTAGILRVFPERPGRSLSLLYFTNSLGAALGVLVSGFFLVRFFGLPGTVRTAGVINLLVAAAVWALVRGVAGAPVPTAASGLRGRVLITFLGVALLTGASSFIYEVAWIRMLTLVLGASTHAFELMLSAFILGLALGGLWIQRRIDRLAEPVRALAWLQIAMGLFALGTLLLYGHTFDAMRWLMNHLPRTDRGYAFFNLSSSGIAMAVMLPATFCAGTTLPLITFHLLRAGRGESSIGAVYAANTVGAILAVFFAVHAGFPLLGLKNLLLFGAAIDLALGVALRPRALPAIAAIASLALCAKFVHFDPYKMASGVYRRGAFPDPAKEKVIFHADGKTASVDVTGNPTSELAILTNGKSDASVSMGTGETFSIDEPTMRLAGALPMSLHPQARTAAVIGFGSGLTTDTLLANPRLTRVDTVEIEPEMVRGARHFRPRNERAYTDPRSRVVIDDAKTFFATQPDKYDLVISEPSNPWVSGVAGLFSDEFYRLVRRHLAQEGLLVQWIQLYEITPDLVVSVLKAIENNFSDYVVYAANDGDAIVVARNGKVPALPDPEVLSIPAVAELLRGVRIHNMQDIEVRRVGTRAAWQGLTRSFAVPMNSDYRPVLDQGAARARFLYSSARPLLSFARNPLPAVQILSGTKRPGTHTDVTGTLYYAGGVRAITAMQLRDSMLRGAQAPSGDAVHALVEWTRSCSPELPLVALLDIAQAMVPELSPAELEAIWRQLETGPCAARLTARDRAWIAFVRACGERDPRRMHAAARELLANETALRPASTRYLLAAGMLGAIAAGESAAARVLWNTYKDRLESAEDLLLRTLIARSQD
jgi:spermidine synthase